MNQIALDISSSVVPAMPLCLSVCTMSKLNHVTGQASKHQCYFEDRKSNASASIFPPFKRLRYLKVAYDIENLGDVPGDKL